MTNQESFDLCVKELFDGGLGARKIANQLNVSRWAIQQSYKRLGIYNIGRSNQRKPIPAEKHCKYCKILKNISEFRKRERKNRISYETICLECEREYGNEACKERYKKNKNKYLSYNRNNREKINKTSREWYNRPIVKLRKRISHAIRNILFTNNSSKLGQSCLKYLSYTMNELKEYLESKFEYWMTWENYGQYILENWDDNDCTTWKWNIDHIIPQSKLPYDSMLHSNFQKCWALNNLRPLSAKENAIKSAS